MSGAHDYHMVFLISPRIAEDGFGACRLVWLGPWLGLWFLYLILVKQNHVALMALAFLFFETFLPIGTVSACAFCVALHEL